MHRRRVAVVVSLGLFIMATASWTAPATAAFPGRNGSIIFERDGDLWTVGLTTAPLQLTSGAAVDRDPQWSSDGRHVAFVRNGVIHTMDAAGGAIMSTGVTGGHPDWSPDGTRIAFDSQAGVLVMSASGSRVRLLVKSRAGSDFYDFARRPAWSPDGRVIAYTHEQGGPDNFLHSIDTIAFVPGATGHAPDCSGTSVAAEWSPDGIQVAVTDTSGVCLTGDNEIYLEGTDGAWAPDGQLVATSTGRILVWRTDGTFLSDVTDGTQPDWQPLCTVTGSAAADNIVGTSGNDVICALGGADRIDARGGADTVYAGPGNDAIAGGPGNDTLFGGTGADALTAGTGRDVLDGGPGGDQCDGGDGLDVDAWCSALIQVGIANSKGSVQVVVGLSNDAPRD